MSSELVNIVAAAAVVVVVIVVVVVVMTNHPSGGENLGSHRFRTIKQQIPATYAGVALAGCLMLGLHPYRLRDNPKT
ncbi:MAG: hypothetical protein LBP52_02620 [Burkholderiaceae bacterium]|jgi:hypothetical protein|nr:hypothetical protein [Burkholderiaceae bacterium]